MRSIGLTVALLSCVTTALAQGSLGGLAGLPTGMSGCPALAAAPVPKATSGPQVATPKECSAVHFVIGRGSCEPPGTGMLQTLVNSIAREVGGITMEGIDYPAALNFSNLLNYVSSSATGATAGKGQITQYSKRCPKSKIVVLGVSQGADVAGSAMCGGGGLLNLTPTIAPVSKEVGSHVVAIVLFGDPRFRKGMSFNRGTSKNQGIIPHTITQDCKDYASRMLSFCDAGDPFCDSGQDLSAHMRVVTTHMEEAKTFLVNKIKTLSVPVQ